MAHIFVSQVTFLSAFRDFTNRLIEISEKENQNKGTEKKNTQKLLKKTFPKLKNVFKTA